MLDHDRPLSKTGRADAADVSFKLQNMGWVPQLILCRFDMPSMSQSDDGSSAQKAFQFFFLIELFFSGSDARRTRETLSVMQERVKGFLQAAVHFIPSFYSVAAMDGQTAEHLQQMICKFSSDDILTVM